MKLRSILEGDFLNLCIYLSSKSQAYWKKASNIDVVILKLKGILEVDFLNYYIYVQSIFEVNFLNHLMYFFSNAEVYLKYTSFHQKSKSINEVLLKYKLTIYLLLFCIFILHLYFFVGSSLKAWALIEDLKYKWNILEVYLNYTSHTAFSLMEDLPILLTPPFYVK